VKVLNMTLSRSRVAKSTGSGGGGTTLDTRLKSAGLRPIWKSAPSGPATSSAKYVPSERPVMRRITSPTRWPWFRAWYPEAVPGSHQGACAASIAVDFSQS